MKKTSLFILIILLSSCTTVRVDIEPSSPTKKEHNVSVINQDNLFESGEVIITPSEYDGITSGSL